MKRTALALILALLFSMVVEVQFVSVVAANSRYPPPPEHIYIKSDGSIAPSTASITRVGNVYTLTSDLPNYAIEVQHDNIVIDGAGYALIGLSPWYKGTVGIILKDRSNVTLKNLNIKGYTVGIKVGRSSYCEISNSNITRYYEDGQFGIQIINSQHVALFENTIFNIEKVCIQAHNSNNVIMYRNVLYYNYPFGWASFGIELFNISGSVIVGNTIGDYSGLMAIKSSFGNLIYCNNFVNNSLLTQVYADYRTYLDDCQPSLNVWDNGTIGNYWSNYNGTDANSDGIGDTPFYLEEDNVDRYPLMSPVDISSVNVELPEWVDNVSRRIEELPDFNLPEVEPFQIILAIAASIVAVAVVGGLSIYFKKRKHQTEI